eukprot:TRINITY_DN19723_c0_g1_i1.p1 TRINITY_DN19723_c0_g1~~TRINITY_DN19723_c0_g1_i1.p1  ORF type:complete len:587 (+),score=129.05 TRINITY_DN19723_c0_g1_i1:171-1931(+)
MSAGGPAACGRGMRGVQCLEERNHLEEYALLKERWAAEEAAGRAPRHRVWTPFGLPVAPFPAAAAHDADLEWVVDQWVLQDAEWGEAGADLTECAYEAVLAQDVDAAVHVAPQLPASAFVDCLARWRTAAAMPGVVGAALAAAVPVDGITDVLTRLGGAPCDWLCEVAWHAYGEAAVPALAGENADTACLPGWVLERLPVDDVLRALLAAARAGGASAAPAWWGHALARPDVREALLRRLAAPLTPAAAADRLVEVCMGMGAPAPDPSQEAGDNAVLLAAASAAGALGRCLHELPSVLKAGSHCGAPPALNDVLGLGLGAAPVVLQAAAARTPLDAAVRTLLCWVTCSGRVRHCGHCPASGGPAPVKGSHRVSRALLAASAARALLGHRHAPGAGTATRVVFAAVSQQGCCGGAEAAGLLNVFLTELACVCMLDVPHLLDLSAAHVAACPETSCVLRRAVRAMDLSEILQVAGSPLPPHDVTPYSHPHLYLAPPGACSVPPQPPDPNYLQYCLAKQHRVGGAGVALATGAAPPSFALHAAVRTAWETGDSAALVTVQTEMKTSGRAVAANELIGAMRRALDEPVEN